MNTKLEDFSLQELREMYPDIRSNSKAKFIAKIREEENTEAQVTSEGIAEEDEFDLVSTEYDDESFEPEVFENGSEISETRAIEGIVAEAGSYNKILLVCENKSEADNLHEIIKNELIQLAEVEDCNFMANDGSLESHFDGKTFYKVVCIYGEEGACSVRKFKTIVHVK